MNRKVCKHGKFIIVGVFLYFFSFNFNTWHQNGYSVEKTFQELFKNIKKLASQKEYDKEIMIFQEVSDRALTRDISKEELSTGHLNIFQSYHGNSQQGNVKESDKILFKIQPGKISEGSFIPRDFIYLFNKVRNEKVKKNESSFREFPQVQSEKSPFKRQKINKIFKFIDYWEIYGTRMVGYEYPVNIIIDNTDNVYVSDRAYNVIYKFKSNEKSMERWLYNLNLRGKKINPDGIALDKDKNMYVCDFLNHRIIKINSIGYIIGEWGSSGNEEGQLNMPTGIAIDSSNYLYVCDSGNHRIVKFDSEGNVIGNWDSYGNEGARIDSPRGIVIDSNKHVFVADRMKGRILKFLLDGVFIKEFGHSIKISDPNLKEPVGLAVDDSGYLYVTDKENHKIFIFDNDGSLIDAIGSEGKGIGQFMMPWGIAIDSNGYLFIADVGNHRIQKFKIR